VQTGDRRARVFDRQRATKELVVVGPALLARPGSVEPQQLRHRRLTRPVPVDKRPHLELEQIDKPQRLRAHVGQRLKQVV